MACMRLFSVYCHRFEFFSSPVCYTHSLFLSASFPCLCRMHFVNIVVCSMNCTECHILFDKIEQPVKAAQISFNSVESKHFISIILFQSFHPNKVDCYFHIIRNFAQNKKKIRRKMCASLKWASAQQIGSKFKLQHFNANISYRHEHFRETINDVMMKIWMKYHFHRLIDRL